MRFRSLLCALLMVAACRPAGDRPPDLEERLRQQEEQLLAQRPAALSAQQAFGADPYKIDYLPGLDRYLVLLRNASQVLLCDPQLKVLDRQSVPRSPAGWARQGEERLYVAGELSSRVAVLALESERLDPLESIELGQSVSVRDLVYLWAGGPTLYLLDGFDRQLLRLDLTRGGQRAYPLGAGPTQILHQDGHLIINLLYEHAILILPVAAGLPDFQKASRIENDGPFWGLAAHRVGDRLIIAAGGIEDHPLDRSGGEFGNVDSFLHLFELRRLERPIAGPFDPLRQSVFHWDAEAERRVSRVNLSELKVVTPKALAFENREGGLELWAAGYGSPRLAVFKVGWNEAGESRAFGGGQSGTEEGTAGDQPESRAGSDPLSGPASRPSGLEVELLRLMESVPGLTDLKLHRRNGRLLLAAANPLLDRVEIRRPSSSGSAPAELASLSFSGQRQAAQASRLGEALFFTTLLSPKNSSEGPLSRLTCEACHFEGHIDGRVHFTGRDDIHLATKTLRGLADNLPLFSRGGDATLSSMVMAEFRVANQGENDVFELQPSHHAWLKVSQQGSRAAQVLTPQQLREAFLSFFVDFRHRPNPWALSRSSLDPLARQGLEVFRERCEDCHQAVESTRAETRAVPFEEWPQWLLDEERDLIWGAAFFSKTGIRPYVDPAGTRVPSLRRVWMKYPYFTDGSSATLEDVLARFRYRGTTVWHHYDPSLDSGSPPSALSSEEADALLATLRYF